MNIDLHFLTDATFWTAVSAIGTLLAVIVSLYLANRTKGKLRIVVGNIYTIKRVVLVKSF